MEDQLEDSAQGIKRLQRCINDLVSLLALPAVWSGRDPSQIVHILLEALLRMLSLEFIYARLNEPVATPPREILRVSDSSKLKLSPQEIEGMLSGWLGVDGHRSPPARDLFGNVEVTIFPVPLGIKAEIGMIVVGSDRADFPGQTESLLLSVAANQASIGLREASLLSEQKRIANELDRQVAERTAELAATNEELRREIAASKLKEEKLRLNEEALREAHAQVAQSEERWRSVFENSAIGVALTDLNGRFIATNPVYQKMLGYTGEELQQIRFLDVTVEKDRNHNWTLIEKLLAGKRRQFQIEKQYRCSNGSLVWVRNNVSLVAGTERVPKFIMALSEDITERKRAEEELRRSETFLVEAQRLSLTGSFSWKVATDEITWSEQLYRIYEFEIGVPVTLGMIRARVHPEDVSLIEKMRMVDQEGVAANDFEWHWRLMMPDHSIKYLHAVAHATRDRDGQLEYIAAVQDVTARRMSEEALAKARSELANVARVTSLGVLTASIAHEVNQPLSGIITNAGTCLRMLSADPPNVDGARETARRTIRDGNRASEVITRLRTLYSKKDLSPELMDLNEAVREVTSLSLSELQRNRVILYQDLAHDLPSVMADRVQLQQVVLNLMRNASDAMSTVDDRPRELLIKTEREDENRVRLSVKDSGVGFTPQSADRLFEAFYTTKNNGMGIGLSISRSIIEAHHGSLWATANDGPGATFSFAIPSKPEALVKDEPRLPGLIARWMQH
jgi:PAS domain S-box-containing protein